jgi:hypothetical protein
MAWYITLPPALKPIMVNRRRRDIAVPEFSVMVFIRIVRQPG